MAILHSPGDAEWLGTQPARGTDLAPIATASAAIRGGRSSEPRWINSQSSNHSLSGTNHPSGEGFEPGAAFPHLLALPDVSLTQVGRHMQAPPSRSRTSYWSGANKSLNSLTPAGPKRKTTTAKRSPSISIGHGRIYRRGIYIAEGQISRVHD